MEKDKKPRKLWDDWNGEYIGNMWGWKFSFISLGLIIFLFLLLLLTSYLNKDKMPVEVEGSEIGTLDQVPGASSLITFTNNDIYPETT